MDHVLFYGILAVSVVFGALIYYANMVEGEPNEKTTAASGEANGQPPVDVAAADRTGSAPDPSLHPGLPSLVSVR